MKDNVEIKKSEKFIIVWIVLIFISVGVTCFLIQPYYEMKTFNKFSKTKATFLDAIMADLRVIPDK